MSELNKFSEIESPFRGEDKCAVFIGRWQPLHFGHIWLINQKLNKGIRVLMMVRDIAPDDKNPFSTSATVKLIKKVFEDKPLKVMVIPDIESVNWGRGVGYEVNEFSPTDDVKMISATFIRNSIKDGNNDWKQHVPETIHEDVLQYLTKYYGL